MGNQRYNYKSTNNNSPRGNLPNPNKTGINPQEQYAAEVSALKDERLERNIEHKRRIDPTRFGIDPTNIVSTYKR